MGWQKCNRCGSNRVISKPLGIGNIVVIGIATIFFVYVYLMFKGLMLMFEGVTLLINSLQFLETPLLVFLIIFFIYRSMGSLYCKDCELTFTPKQKVKNV